MEIDRCMAESDRKVLNEHFTAIAQILLDKRLWRNVWRVELEGCVYRLKVEGYAKHGSPVWKEQQRERTDGDN